MGQRWNISPSFRSRLRSETGTPLVRPAVNRFVVSYDVWEEKFSVSSTVLERATASHLSAAAAESWCLDHLPLGIDGVPRDKPLWIKLELRAEDARDQTGVFGSSSINLTRLIEVFSNPARAQQMHWEASAGSGAPRGPKTGAPELTKRVNRLRNKLILVFLAATVVPWGATLWMTTSLPGPQPAVPGHP